MHAEVFTFCRCNSENSVAARQSSKDHAIHGAAVRMACRTREFARHQAFNDARAHQRTCDVHISVDRTSTVLSIKNGPTHKPVGDETRSPNGEWRSRLGRGHAWTWLRFGHEVFIEVYDDLSHFGNPTLKPDIIETN
jgi:hypothetical protein